MKKLNRKVFTTLYLILSLFIVFCLMIYNVDAYNKEYHNVRRNLTLLDDKDNHKNDNPDNKNINDKEYIPQNESLDNMMIMDYEIYTVKLNDQKIEKIINHSHNDSEFAVQKIAKKIIHKKEGITIGNLYHNSYSYNYRSDMIVIMNTKMINSKLLYKLITSIIFLIGIEVVMYYISKSLTKRITKPAQVSFDKQKDFIADASHELKTPLAIIMASADELEMDKKNKKYIDNIKYEAERMNNLIKNLLDLSSLDSGIDMNNYQDEDISKVVEKTSLTFEGIAFEKNITIDSNIENNIHLKCIKEEIERLIAIILDNAVKHGYKNSKINIDLKSNKKYIYIDITNSGKPIKKEDEEKIFERFYRVDKSRNREDNRYGLGLAIAKKIVVNHSGTIKAYSKDGKTTFSITLKK